MTEERLDAGYVIVLPGIEGYSHWNKNIVRGLVSAGLPYGIEIYDWTLGRLLTPFNFFARKRQQAQTEILVDKISGYRSRFPDRPVFLIGHSGGGAMTLLTLSRLPEEVRVTRGVLIGAAISRHYDVRPALNRTTSGLVNVSSWGDVLFLGASSLVGNIDKRWTFAAGLSGFSSTVHGQVASCVLPPLIEISYEPRFALKRNFGGHFGGVAPRFVQHFIAPQIRASLAVEPAREAPDQIQAG